MIITIVSNKDTENVLDKLSEARFSATRVSTTGLFLEGGHSCLFIGVEDSKVDEVFEVLQGAVTKELFASMVLKALCRAHCCSSRLMLRNSAAWHLLLMLRNLKSFN